MVGISEDLINVWEESFKNVMADCSYLEKCCCGWGGGGETRQSCTALAAPRSEVHAYNKEQNV